MKKRSPDYKYLIPLLLIVALLPKQATASKDMKDKPDTFEYQLEGRTDPFTPFISAKTISQLKGTDEIVDEKIELTGMRQFEPGQLTLVAIMHSGKHNLAMAQDVTGRGYVLTEGMAIGRRGRIKLIGDEQVRIIETAHTRSGKTIENPIVMRLNKEGDI